MREIMRIAAAPDDEERERWSWAGEVDPFDQVRAVLRDYDDEALLREFLTPEGLHALAAVRLRAATSATRAGSGSPRGRRTRSATS